MKILIETIPHSEQRYRTCGDWEYLPDPTGANDRVLRIRVSEMGDWRYAALVAVHELFEVLCCQHDGVTQEQVDKFDMDFENYREAAMEEAAEAGKLGQKTLLEIMEPGDQPDAPYRKQHCLATAAERMLASAIGVNWSHYKRTVETL